MYGKPIKYKRATQIKRFMQEAGMSQRDLAEEAGVNYNGMLNQLQTIAISDERLKTLELAAIRLGEKRSKRIAELVEQFKANEHQIKA